MPLMVSSCNISTKVPSFFPPWRTYVFQSSPEYLGSKCSTEGSVSGMHGAIRIQGGGYICILSGDAGRGTDGMWWVDRYLSSLGFGWMEYGARVWCTLSALYGKVIDLVIGCWLFNGGVLRIQVCWDFYVCKSLDRFEGSGITRLLSNGVERNGQQVQIPTSIQSRIRCSV